MPVASVILPIYNDQRAVDIMSASLVHRGPDGEGKFNTPHLTMMMQRLSIIDLDSGGQQVYNIDRVVLSSNTIADLTVRTKNRTGRRFQCLP